MNNEQIIWTMTTELLADFYNASNVFDAYQNNYKQPVTNDFVMINKLDIGQVASPIPGFNAETQRKTLMGFGDWPYQIDLYGSNAEDGANLLYTYLYSSAASNYLLSYELGIGKLKKPRNTTFSNDREKYMKRYSVEFTALNIVNVSIPSSGTSNINIEYKEFT